MDWTITEPRTKAPATLHAKRYQRRVWLTRPRPQIDRVGSAWLIRKFIDPHARFVFAPKPEAQPDAIPYDMMNVEFTHHGDACTFETLLKRFAIADHAVVLVEGRDRHRGTARALADDPAVAALYLGGIRAAPVSAGGAA